MDIFRILSFNKKVYILFIWGISSVVFPKTLDDELWGSIEINKLIYRNFEFELEQEIRYTYPYNVFDKTFTDLSLSYSVTPIIELSAKYRYIVFDDKKQSRIGFNFKINPDIHFLIPTYKIKFQQDYDKNKDPEDLIIRNKFTFEYLFLKKLTPNFYYESYHRKEEDILIYNKYRISVGIEYDLSMNHAVELFYIYKYELGKNENDIINIFGLKYEYTF